MSKTDLLPLPFALMECETWGEVRLEYEVRGMLYAYEAALSLLGLDPEIVALTPDLPFTMHLCLWWRDR